MGAHQVELVAVGEHQVMVVNQVVEVLKVVVEEVVI